MIVRDNRLHDRLKPSYTEACELVRELKQGNLIVKDRRHLVEAEAIAIAIGQNLLYYNLIIHVCHKRDFKNEFLYQFTDER